MDLKPQLLSWLVCDGVHIDPASGKHFVMGIFSTIRVRKFPATHPRMVWFLSLSDVQVGDHSLKISIGLPMNEKKVIVERKFESQSPLHRLNLINNIQNLQFNEPGNYSIIIEIDDEHVLVTSLSVTQ